VRRYGFLVTALALLVASCGGGSDKSSGSTLPIPTTSVTTSVTTAVPQTTTPSTLPDVATTTTGVPCPGSGGATAPVTTGKAQVPALLHSVQVTSALCVDLVRFGFTTKTDASPSCVVSYQDGPFTADASGRAVSVAGNAFVVVRCTPAYGYDFDSGKPTYTGAPLITPNGTRWVRQLVETGDFEGVLTWVIGLDAKRPYSVAAATTPHGAKFDSALVITFS
jgi:hypothetical protein